MGFAKVKLLHAMSTHIRKKVLFHKMFVSLTLLLPFVLLTSDTDTLKQFEIQHKDIVFVSLTCKICVFFNIKYGK